MSKENNDYTNINSAATTIVRSSRGTLARLVINSITAGTVTIFDSITGSGDVVAVIAVGATIGDIEYDLVVTNGITIVTTMADNLTVVFSD